jgi:hypothetical protein
MRILIIAKKNPHPVKDGEAIAIMQLAEGLHEAGNNITLLAMNTPKHSYDIEQLPETLKKKFDSTLSG